MENLLSLNKGNHNLKNYSSLQDMEEYLVHQPTFELKKLEYSMHD